MVREDQIIRVRRLIDRVFKKGNTDAIDHIAPISSLTHHRGRMPKALEVYEEVEDLIGERQQEIHEKIARIVEDRYSDRLEAFYEMLAYHYAKSDNQEKAYHYLKLSGDKAVKRRSNREALLFYEDAIAILRQTRQTAERPRGNRFTLSFPWGPDALPELS